MNQLTQRLHRRTLRLLGLILIVSIIAINVAAFFHAHAMTHFAKSRERTPRPEELSLFQQLKVLVSGIILPRPENSLTPGNYLIPFTTDTISSGESIQLELWLIDQPQSSTTIAIFHGYGASKDALLAEASLLYHMGYSVCLVDFRGSGGSTGDYTTIGWEEADDVAAVTHYIHQRSPEQTLWLYGQSMGAAAVLRAVSLEPEIADGLILEAIYDRLLVTVKNRFEAMHTPPTPFAHLLLFWGSIQNHFNAFCLNPDEYASNVKVPTLMLHGALDERARVSDAQAVYDALSGEKKLVIFDGVGHQSCLDSDSTLWRNEITAFLGNSGL